MLAFLEALEIGKLRPLLAKVTSILSLKGEWIESGCRRLWITLSLDLWEGGEGPVRKKVAEKSRILPYIDRSGEQRWSIGAAFAPNEHEKSAVVAITERHLTKTLIWLVSFSLLI